MPSPCGMIFFSWNTFYKEIADMVRQFGTLNLVERNSHPGNLWRGTGI